MSDTQPRKPAGTPSGGEFAGKTGSPPASTLRKPAGTHDPADRWANVGKGAASTLAVGSAASRKLADKR